MSPQLLWFYSPCVSPGAGAGTVVASVSGTVAGVGSVDGAAGAGVVSADVGDVGVVGLVGAVVV